MGIYEIYITLFDESKLEGVLQLSVMGISTKISLYRDIYYMFHYTTFLYEVDCFHFSIFNDFAFIQIPTCYLTMTGSLSRIT